MGLLPPGSGKSIYTSVVFPTHVMGRFKGFNTIVASYGSELPRKFGRRARSITQQPIYKRIFDTPCLKKARLLTSGRCNGSEWMAAGILTGITGNRADGVIWDDLIKGREQADSLWSVKRRGTPMLTIFSLVRKPRLGKLASPRAGMRTMWLAASSLKITTVKVA
jgi:hypothetical protein